jgi:hypothetical protein
MTIFSQRIQCKRLCSVEKNPSILSKGSERKWQTVSDVLSKFDGVFDLFRVSEMPVFCSSFFRTSQAGVGHLTLEHTAQFAVEIVAVRKRRKKCRQIHWPECRGVQWISFKEFGERWKVE